MDRIDATAKKRGGVLLWVSPGLMLGMIVADVRADQAQCESIYQSIEAIVLEDDRQLPAVPKLSPEAARKKFANQFAPLDATVSSYLQRRRARRYMRERVEHAKRNPGFGLLDGAQSSLAELEQRIAEERKSPAPSLGAH